jgi:hypothetical protein
LVIVIAANMRRREGGGEAMVRGEEVVATADEKMGEAEGGC